MRQVLQEAVDLPARRERGAIEGIYILNSQVSENMANKVLDKAKGVIYYKGIEAVTNRRGNQMKNIQETWTIEATAGAIGVNENTFQYAIIERSAAKTPEDAIAFVGANDWQPSGNKSVVSVFARESFAFDENVGNEESGEPGSVGTPDFDSLEDALEAASEEE